MNYWPKCSKFDKNYEPIDPRIQGNPSANGVIKHTLGHIVVMKQLRAQDEESTLKMARGKGQVTHGGSAVKMTPGFVRTSVSSGEVEISRALKEKTSVIQESACGVPFKNKGEVPAFWTLRSWKSSSALTCTTRNLFKKCPAIRRKMTADGIYSEKRIMKKVMTWINKSYFCCLKSFKR